MFFSKARVSDARIMKKSKNALLQSSTVGKIEGVLFHASARPHAIVFTDAIC